MKTAIITLTLSLLTFCGIAADAPTTNEQKSIQGTWIVESATEDGKAEDAFGAFNAGDQWVFANGQLAIRDKDGKEQPRYTRTFKIDSTKAPKALVLVPTRQAPNSEPEQLAYDLSGNTLKLVLSAADKFPTEISDKGQLLITLKRKRESEAARKASETALNSMEAVKTATAAAKAASKAVQNASDATERATKAAQNAIDAINKAQPALSPNLQGSK